MIVEIKKKAFWVPEEQMFGHLELVEEQSGFSSLKRFHSTTPQLFEEGATLDYIKEYFDKEIEKDDYCRKFDWNTIETWQFVDITLTVHV